MENDVCEDEDLRSDLKVLKDWKRCGRLVASILLKSGQSEAATKLLQEAGVSLDLGALRVEHTFEALEARARLYSLSENWTEAQKTLQKLDEIGDELSGMQLFRRRNIESICLDAGISPQLSDD